MFSDTIDHLEKLRVDLLVKRCILRHPSVSIKKEDNHFYQPIAINNYPVFQFRYEGSMPLYKEKDKKYLDMVRDYYYQATLDMYDYPNVDIQFDKVAIIIQHVFPQRRIRDTDNRNRKYVVDAIRYTGLINDDNMDELILLEEGYIKENSIPYVNVMVLDSDNLVDFLPYREEYALKVFKEIDESISWDNFEKKYAEFLQRKMENERAFEELF